MFGFLLKYLLILAKVDKLLLY